MKNSGQSILQILAPGLAGVAVCQVANSSFIAALPAETLAAFVFSAGLVGLAAYDYSRRFRSLNQPGRILRPATRTAIDRRPGRTDRIAA